MIIKTIKVIIGRRDKLTIDWIIKQIAGSSGTG
jgi:hypothetical protein